MIDRCANCTGPTREACDKRFSIAAELTAVSLPAIVACTVRGDLVSVVKMEESVTSAFEAFEDRMNRDGCELSDLDFLTRLATEMQLRTWEEPLPPEPAT
ncbi:hypothetical protein KC963_05270 [Candidatus Saccharibacteria bacterium]|nr:hypothetical protein [Candidatus Saccharibacteria bacterium]MCA9337418.1 hypothetical protein [Candidatus Saccharibacteria bacterium]